MGVLFFKRLNKKTVLAQSFCFLLFLGACTEPIHKRDHKLHVLLDEDLKFIVAEVQKASGDKYLLKEPYYEIKEFHEFTGDTARDISAIAVVQFHYLDSLRIAEERKYRYRVVLRHWERYYKKMKHLPKENS